MPESQYLWSGIQSSSPDRPGEQGMRENSGKASEAEHLFEKYLCHVMHPTPTHQPIACSSLASPFRQQVPKPKVEPRDIADADTFFSRLATSRPKVISTWWEKASWREERSKCLLIFSSRFIVHTIDDHAIFLPSLTSQPSKRILLDRKRERFLKGSSRVWHFVFGKDQPC